MILVVLLVGQVLFAGLLLLSVVLEALLLVVLRVRPGVEQTKGERWGTRPVEQVGRPTGLSQDEASTIPIFSDCTGQGTLLPVPQYV